MSEMTLDRIIKAALMPDDELQCLIDVQAELKCLRGIEEAVIRYGPGETLADAIEGWRELERQFPVEMGGAGDAIAKALEEKPE